MGRLALVLAFAAMAAAGLPSPGLYLAIGLGLAAIGCGLHRFGRKDLPGGARIAGAAAMTIGTLGVLLGAVRVAMVVMAIDKIDRLLP